MSTAAERRASIRSMSVFASILVVLLLAAWIVAGYASPSAVRDAQSMTTSQLSAGQRYVATEVTAITKRELEASDLSERDVSRAQTITLMTALQESSMRNLGHGDADSLGLYQQRPSMGWGDEEQVRDPQWATSAFLGTNPQVENPGLLDIEGWQTMAPNDAAQAVQRSNHPEQYGRWESLAASLRDEAETGYAQHRETGQAAAD